MKSTYIAIHHFHSLFSLFNSTHGDKSKPSTPISFPVVNNLQKHPQKYRNIPISLIEKVIDQN